MYHHQRENSNSSISTHTTVNAVPVIRNNGYHQKQSSFNMVSPPTQDWFGTSLDSNNSSSFGKSPMSNMLSPSAFEQEESGDHQQQRNLQEMFEKRRKRRESHNAVERRRRDNINERIHELCSLLPERLLDSAPSNANVINQQGGGGRAINKGTILKLSVDHIKELRYEIMSYQERIQELEVLIEQASKTTGFRQHFSHMQLQ